MKITLKSKLVTISLLLTIIIGSLIGIGAFFYIKNVLVDQKIEEIINIHTEKINEYKAVFDKHRTFAMMLGTRTRVMEFLQDRSEVRRLELEGIFEEYAKNNLQYLAIYLLDEKGDALISTDKRFLGQNYAFREYFIESMNGEEYVGIFLGKTSNELGYYFSYPVYNKNKDTIGVVVLKLDSKEVSRLIENSQIIKSNKIMLSDGLGVVISTNKKNALLKSFGELNTTELNELKTSQRFLDYKINSLQYDNVQDVIRNYKENRVVEFFDKEDGEKEILDVRRIGNLPLYSVVEIGIEQINKDILFIIFVIVIGFFVSSIFMSILIMIFVTKFLSPIEKIKKSLENAGSGNFAEDLNIVSGDEFEDLANGINTMNHKLKDVYDNLEDRIREKTSEVEKQKEDLEQQKVAVLNILEDVQEEKTLSESLARDLEKFRLAVEDASDHIVITDSNGIVLYANKAVEKITGFKAEGIIGKKVGNKELWGGLMDIGFYKKLWKTIKQDKKVFSGEINNHRKGGEQYIALANISPVLDNNGNVVFFVGIERDVTKERQVDKAKTEFVSLASHQLRTPLSSINWYAEMLLAGDAGKLNKEQKQFVNEIYAGNQRMVELVNALLNVSRLELGTFTIEPVPTDIIELSESIIKELQPSILSKKLKLRKDYDNSIGKINVDPALTRMIFQNLLSNATKYTPDGGNISVSIKKDTKNVLIDIEDSGYGIPKAQHDKIFTKLFRADNVKAKDTEGTGLGLYIIKSIVDNAKGKISFISEENEGTKFHIELPLSGMTKKEGSKKLS